MGKFIDLTGQRFGRLTVLSRAEDYVDPRGRHERKWLCRCDCGNEISVNEHHLKDGHTKSCGCRKIKDLTGQKFGKLTVICRAEDKFHKNGERIIRWHCKCECGNECDVKSNNLTSGSTRSCGCLHYIPSHINTNTYCFEDDHVIITTKKGDKIIIDKQDFENCKKYAWYIDGYGYPKAPQRVDDKFHFKSAIALHRLILNVIDEDVIVDHIDGNPLNNTRNNLRICTRQENNKNTKSRINGRYPGVRKYRNKYEARIGSDNHVFILGYFDTEEEAIQARIEAEDKYHGEFGYYNSRIKNKEESV